jgi:hypothetical protein
MLSAPGMLLGGVLQVAFGGRVECGDVRFGSKTARSPTGESQLCMADRVLLPIAAPTPKSAARIAPSTTGLDSPNVVAEPQLPPRPAPSLPQASRHRSAAREAEALPASEPDNPRDRSGETARPRGHATAAGHVSPAKRLLPRGASQRSALGNLWTIRRDRLYAVSGTDRASCPGS